MQRKVIALVFALLIPFCGNTATAAGGGSDTSVSIGDVKRYVDRGSMIGQLPRQKHIWNLTRVLPMLTTTLDTLYVSLENTLKPKKPMIKLSLLTLIMWELTNMLESSISS